MATFTDYNTSASGAVSAGSVAGDTQDASKYWTLAKLKRAYLDYLGAKREEIDEQQDARRFRHASQWTAEQIRQLNLRKQPVITNNKIARKINGIVGTLERLKQDPKAYARTPKHEQGAELATAVIRYVLDEQQFDQKDPVCAEMCGIDGFSGIEINMTRGDMGDPEIELAVVQSDGFFYDPRSYMLDFSDARFMGVGKWMDFDTASELFPDKKADLEDSMVIGWEMSTNSDREQKWFSSDGDKKWLRLVECWYKMNGEWCYAIFTGSTKLMEGKSYLKDEKGKSSNKYIMFSAYVDQDGDRYGFVRDLKPLQMEINMRRSKALYTMLSRRIIAEAGAFDDIEVARREAARSDGIVIRNPGTEAIFDDAARQAETQAQFEFLKDIKEDFESFGPNIAVTGQGLEQSSGRAIHLLQQAGLADLGPFIQSYRGWKIRTYRAIWNAIQNHWTAERWIRVTDDDDLSQFIQVNGVGVDPHTGLPTLVNSLGNLDVDIILDEGPDSVNAMADAYDTLTVLAGKGGEVPTDVLIELAPLPMSLKKRILERLQPQPTPEQQQQQQLQMQMAVESVKEKAGSAQLKQAQAMKTAREAAVVQPEQPDVQTQAPGDHPMKIQSEAMDKEASANQKWADAEKKRAETQKIHQDIQLEPQRMAMEHQAAQQKMHQDAMNAEADRQLQARQAEMSAKQQARDSDRNYKVNTMKAKQKPQGNK